MRIMKFGGTSVADPPRIERVVGLVRGARRAGPLVVVVSAFSRVTDALIAISRAAAAKQPAALAELHRIGERHSAAIRSLAAAAEQPALERRFAIAMGELEDLVRGISLLGECTPRTRDRLLSYGERLSAMVVAAALRHAGEAAEDCDARELVLTDEGFGNAQVDHEATYERIRRHFAEPDRAALQVVTGFIASSRSGETTTLGRSGSDLTAALFGAALAASVIEIWTDVDGVMSADPRLVADAFSLERLSYEELMELSHFGAKVVFPPTVQPARQLGIPLLIKNTLNPDFPGTMVSGTVVSGTVVSGSRVSGSRVDAGAPRPITGIASINDVALLRLEGEGMLGIPGIARRLFGALAQEGINVILITQASSEHSICFAIDPATTAAARRALEREFALELDRELLYPLVIEERQCIIAIVGEGMRERPGIAGRLFRVLGQRGINVRAIAQGSSELNISIVLACEDEERALRAIHDSFFRSEDDTFKLVVAGCGGVGSALLDRLARLADALRRERGIDLRVCGVLDSRSMLLERDGVALPEGKQSWKEHLAHHGRPADLDSVRGLLEELSGLRGLVDCTASDAVPELYAALLRSGCAVITANKRPFAGPRARDPRQQVRSDGRGLYYSATAGAGLPVVRTLQALVRSGERPQRIEGVFSGTMGFLLGELRAGRRFSEALRQARERGYTEPDPRDDLSGQDVARKLLVLAREVGLDLELADVEVEALVPEDLAALDLESFWQRAEALDEAMAERVQSAKRDGRVLCYLAELGTETASGSSQARVGLSAVEPTHPCARLAGTDNLFAFYSEHYPRPLQVQGPGAGARVTALGLFADILRAHAESVRDHLIESAADRRPRPWASAAPEP